MPDWTYHTLIRPVFQRIGPDKAQRLTRLFLDGLSRLPGGPAVVDFFGHSRPDSRLRSAHASLPLASPTGLSASLVGEGRGLAALERFGVGLMELGPVGETGSLPTPARWDFRTGAIRRDAPLACCHLEAVKACLQRSSPAQTRRLVRLSGSLSPARIAEAVKALADLADGFVLDLENDTGREDRLRAFADSLQSETSSAIGLISVSADVSARHLLEMWSMASRLGIDGVQIRAETDHGRSEGQAHFRAVLACVGELAAHGNPPVLILAGGAHSPRDAQALLQAGAHVAMLDTGLFFSGPGLPKRINEALLSLGSEPTVPEDALPWSRTAGFWAALMGAGLLVGSVIALVVASTRVVLPYDEVFCGLNRSQLAALNDKLLPFMAHDRVTLAGVMVSCAVLYLGLALGGMGRGRHWAKMTVVSSALAGFFSFFLFLGFGYFDPFHAFVSAVLFQFLLLTLYARVPRPQRPEGVDWEESTAWRRGQWGQLLMVLIGLGVVGAGLVISLIGISEVFVREDLEFLGTTREALVSANERLVPLVAHDRASLGGMLIATGLAVWLSAQWGIGPGRRWLWWTYLLAGLPAFAAAIGVHYAVGYTSPVHLAPAFVGLAGWLLALLLLKAWLCPATTPLPGAGSRRR